MGALISSDANGFMSEIRIGNSYVNVKIQVRKIIGEKILVEVVRLSGQTFDFLRVSRTIRQTVQE
jgi:hypothetical protein